MPRVQQQDGLHRHLQDVSIVRLQRRLRLMMFIVNLLLLPLWITVWPLWLGAILLGLH